MELDKRNEMKKMIECLKIARDLYSGKKDILAKQYLASDVCYKQFLFLFYNMFFSNGFFQLGIHNWYDEIIGLIKKRIKEYPGLKDVEGKEETIIDRIHDIRRQYEGNTFGLFINADKGNRKLLSSIGVKKVDLDFDSDTLLKNMIREGFNYLKSSQDSLNGKEDQFYGNVNFLYFANYYLLYSDSFDYPFACEVERIASHSISFFKAQDEKERKKYVKVAKHTLKTIKKQILNNPLIDKDVKKRHKRRNQFIHLNRGV